MPTALQTLHQARLQAAVVPQDLLPPHPRLLLHLDQNLEKKITKSKLVSYIYFKISLSPIFLHFSFSDT